MRLPESIPWLLLGLVALGVPACGSAQPRPSSVVSAMGDSQVDANHELWGTWTSRLDGTLMELSPTSFHLRFPYRGMVRDNYARVLRHDPDAHHVYLEYVRVLDDSIEQPLPANPRSCMTYMITEGILRKWIGTGTCAGPEKVTFEEFVK